MSPNHAPNIVNTHKHYDLLSLLICDNSKITIKNQMHDVTIKFIIAHGDTNSTLLTWFSIKCPLLKNHSDKMFHQATRKIEVNFGCFKLF